MNHATPVPRGNAGKPARRPCDQFHRHGIHHQDTGPVTIYRIDCVLHAGHTGTHKTAYGHRW